jgi:3-oxoacyl-(acyl-carrier-protein) synthase
LSSQWGPDRRVVITGMGAVTTLGADLASTLAALRRGESARPDRLAAADPAEVAAITRVPDFDVRRHFPAPKALKVCDRRTRLAVAAAEMALADAGFATATERAEFGVVLGTSSSDPGIEDLAAPLASDPDERSASDVAFFAERILNRLHPLWLVVQLPNMTSAHVAIQFGLQGPNSTVMTDWVAGMQAIGEAFLWIKNGEAEVVLAGGADVGTTQLTQICYRQQGLFAGGDSGSPPLAEGAAVLVLEEREHARRRGAPIHGEVRGYGSAAGSDGVEPMSRLVTQTLAAAGWETRSVGVWTSTGAVSRESRSAEQRAAAISGIDPAAVWFDPAERLGHALAAQGPIAATLALATYREPSARLWCGGSGLLGQTAGLALTTSSEDPLS